MKKPQYSHEEIAEIMMNPKIQAANKKLSSSKGAKHVKNYFLDFLKRDDVQQEVRSFREKYNIQEGGFRMEDGHVVHNSLLFPKKWVYALSQSEEFWDNFSADIRLMYKKFQLPYFSESFLDRYLVYNLVEESFLPGLCSVRDAFFPLSQEDFELEVANYPVLIGISPYASQRDIIDYVKALYTVVIKPLQELYRDEEVGLGKSKTKDEAVRQRDNFIYEHRHLSLNKTMKLLKEKSWFGKNRLGQSEIASIRSVEAKKRRKKV